MEGCIELTDVAGDTTTTTFMKNNIFMGKRVIFIDGPWKTERWYNFTDKQHRDNDLPTTIIYKNSKITRRCWYKDGKLHRDNDLPAEINYEDEGKIRYQGWYKDGKLHRENDLPAEIHYEDEGKIRYQGWYKDGKLHRDGQPAEIYYEDGKITLQYWYKDGKLYREIGPTRIEIKDGIIVNHWYNDKVRSGLNIFGRINYLNVPEKQRLSPEFRQAMRRLPLPIGDAIAWHFMEIWQFVDVD